MGGAEVWHRNSLRLGTYQPLVSDIDISLYLTDVLPSNQAQQIKITAQKIKSFFPILGEINLYSNLDREILRSSFNQFEMQRDPELMRRLGFEASTDEHSLKPQRAVFLFKMLFFDIHNVRAYPQARLKKWQYHLGRNVDPEHLLEEILAELASLLNFQSETKKHLLEAIDLFLKPPEKVNFENECFSDPWVWCFLVNHIGYAWGNRPELSAIQASVARYMIQWEFHGLLSQMRLGESHIDFKVHLQHLKICAFDLEPEIEGAFSLKKGLSYLETLGDF